MRHRNWWPRTVARRPVVGWTMIRGPIAGCGWSAGRDGCASPIRSIKLPPVSTQHRIRLDHRGGIVRSLLRLQPGLFRPGLIEFFELFLDFLLPFQGRIDVFSRRRSGRLDDLGRFALFGRFRRVGDITFVIDDLVDVICEKAGGHQGDAGSDSLQPGAFPDRKRVGSSLVPKGATCS